MEPISADMIEKTLQRMDEMTASDVKALMDLMGKEQPYVLAYLLSVGGDSLNLDERELLIYLGTVIWQIMRQSSGLFSPDGSIRQISAETLDKFEEKNWKMLEYLQDEPEADFEDTVEKIFKNYPQPEVLRYVIESLMAESEEAEDYFIRDENIGIMSIYLKTIIDCFNE